MSAREARLPPRPRKRFGQHFLHDRRVLERIVAALAPESSSTVLEIGPGQGALTDLLVGRAAGIVGIEVDRDLAALLKRRYQDAPSVNIVEGDALALSWADLVPGPYLLCGNLPYNITTPLLFHALAGPPPDWAVLLVQREVADRMAAAPGSKTYGALSVNLQVAMQPEVVAIVPAGAFRPSPRVDSAIIRLVPLTSPLVARPDVQRFRRFVQGVFGLRRKQMVRVVRELWSLDAHGAAVALRAAEIEPSARPETLSPARFVRLFEARAREQRDRGLANGESRTGD